MRSALATGRDQRMSSVVKHSSEADIESLEKLCERLAGFGVDVSLEWVDGFMTAAQKAVTTMETQADTAKSGAKDVGQKAMGFAEQNITNSFEFAQKLVRAKDIQEVMALQQEYLQSQMKAMSEQAKDLGGHATKMAMDSAKPKT